MTLRQRSPSPKRQRSSASAGEADQAHGQPGSVMCSDVNHVTRRTRAVACELMTYEEAVAAHEWHVPERYNIASDVCDKHPRDKLAMVHEHFDGTVREVQLGRAAGARQPLRQRAARARRRAGDRVAMLLPPTPETAAAFFGTWKLGAILLSMSVLYGDDGIRHRVERLAAEGARHRTRRTRPRIDHRWSSTCWCSTTSLLDGAPTDLRARRTPPPTTRPSSTTRPARPGWPRASSTRTATCSPTRSSSTATTCRTASASTAWASGRGRRASRRCSARGASARCSASTSARAASTRTSSSTSSRATRSTNVFTTPTAMRSMMAIGDAGTRYPQKFRIVCCAGEPLNPEAIRWFREQYGLTVLDYYGLTESYPLVRELPVHGRPRGLDGPADARLGRADPRRGRAAGGAGRARRDLPARALEPALSARLLEQRRRPARRRSAATGSTPRTPPRRTRTATSGTRAAPTT